MYSSGNKLTSSCTYLRTLGQHSPICMGRTHVTRVTTNFEKNPVAY